MVEEYYLQSDAQSKKQTHHKLEKDIFSVPTLQCAVVTIGRNFYHYLVFVEDSVNFA